MFEGSVPSGRISIEDKGNSGIQPREAKDASPDRGLVSGDAPDADAVPWPSNDLPANDHFVQSEAALPGSDAEICDRLAAQKFDIDRPAGVKPVEKVVNPTTAIDVCLRAAKESPDKRRLLYQLARSYDYAEDLSRAQTYLIKAARLGSSRALAHLAEIYALDQLGKNYSRARRFAEVAASHGDVPALHFLAYTYEKGLGTSQDMNKARGLYERAASAGEERSQIALGDIYRFGIGVAADYSKARSFFQAADPAPTSDGGRPTAIETLRFLASNADCDTGETVVQGMISYNSNYFLGSFSRWRFVRVVRTFMVGSESSTFSVHTSARLADLSSTVRVNDKEIILRCTQPDCIRAITVYSEPSDSCGGSRYCSVYLNRQKYSFCDAGQANRIARAIEHLLTLKGGKPSLFE